MDRIKSDGAVNNRFVDSNPASNVPGTVLSAKWLNDVQEELANIVTRFNVSLDATKQDQVATIIKGLDNKLNDVIRTLNSVVNYLSTDVYGDGANTVYSKINSSVNARLESVGKPDKTVTIVSLPTNIIPPAT